MDLTRDEQHEPAFSVFGRVAAGNRVAIFMDKARDRQGESHKWFEVKMRLRDRVFKVMPSDTLGGR